MSALHPLLYGGDVNAEQIYYLPFECMCAASFTGSKVLQKHIWNN